VDLDKGGVFLLACDEGVLKGVAKSLPFTSFPNLKMFKNISLQAKSSLLQLGKLPIKPFCQELAKLDQTRNFLAHELPIRYIHLIKLLSVNHLGTVLTRVLEDVDLLQSTGVLNSETVAILSNRLENTLDMVSEHYTYPEETRAQIPKGFVCSRRANSCVFLRVKFF
jgi:hypothetical protein